MKRTLSCLLFIIPQFIWAATITGIVKDGKGKPLPFASVLIKGTARGTTANSKGQYSLPIEPGEHTLVCQHVGYATEEKKITVGKTDSQIDFQLQEQQYNLQNVTVKSGGEDPAYEIIRQAIKKREEHLNELKQFQCEVYLKGQLQLRNYPKRFLGETVDFEDGDTSKRKMIFLSEGLANYSVDGKNKKKVEVISTKVSGQTGGFGFSVPQIFSFYENNISIGQGLNPRGFISPISNNALNYYKYHFEGTFFENGREVSRIKVIPRRKYEPLFTGYINIVEDEWRLQSVQLTALKEQQMQFLDTLTIEQLYVPLKNVWVMKQQVIYPAGKIFNFDFFGNFVQVYDKYNIEPVYEKKFFGNTIIKFLDSSNKRTLAYWDSIRPIPLLPAEARDYVKKDSLEQVRKSPRYMDSLDRRRNKVTIPKLLLFGQNFNSEKNKSNISINPLLTSFDSYNNIEGYVTNFSGTYFKRWEGRKSLSITPTLRYGFGNTHLNASVAGRYNFGTKYNSSFNFAGGRKVFQVNNADPISGLENTFYYKRDYLKIYEANFLRLGYSKSLGDGFTASISAQYQDRVPLANSIISNKEFAITENITWRPGGKYIEFPDRKIGIRSKYPTFNLSVTEGLNGPFGSNADFTKWHLGMSDDLNFKLGGRFNYRLEVGGFLNAKNVSNVDYQHYLGNQTVFASQYLSSFQLLPYYQYSNIANVYTTAHAEYHLNGLLTNKIPGFRRLNWFLVFGGNALYIDKNSHYYEAFISLENIFKIVRLDFIQGFQPNGSTISGVRFSLPLFASGRGN